MKVNFFNGASLSDPHGLFNGGMEAKASRSIDLAKGEQAMKAVHAAFLG